MMRYHRFAIAIAGLVLGELCALAAASDETAKARPPARPDASRVSEARGARPAA